MIRNLVRPHKEEEISEAYFIYIFQHKLFKESVTMSCSFTNRLLLKNGAVKNPILDLRHIKMQVKVLLSFITDFLFIYTEVLGVFTLGRFGSIKTNSGAIPLLERFI